VSDRRVFVGHPLSEGDHWVPDPSTLHYLSRVLRVTPGEEFHGFDASAAGYRLEWRSEVEGFRVLRKISPASPPPWTLSLFQALPKGPKFDQILRQCTEAGVQAFFPLLTERTVVRLAPEEREGKLGRWEKILQEASRQCGRSDVPSLDCPMDWAEGLDRLGSFDLIVMLYEGKAEPLRQVLESNRQARRLALLVGPEGGWSPAEVEAAVGRGARTAHLPTPILRTETAPLAATAMIRFHFS